MVVFNMTITTAEFEKLYAAFDRGSFPYGYGYDRRRGKRAKDKDAICWYWITGGVSGGSCWDSSDPRSYTSDEVEPEPTKLEEFLMIAAEDISFLRFKKISALVVREDFCQYEYYGNCDEYQIRYIEKEVLLNALVEAGCVLP